MTPLANGNVPPPAPIPVYLTEARVQELISQAVAAALQGLRTELAAERAQLAVERDDLHQKRAALDKEKFEEANSSTSTSVAA